MVFLEDKLSAVTEFYINKFMIDNVTGRVLDTNVVREGDSFVFTPIQSGTKTITADQIKPPVKDAYLEFADINRKAEEAYRKMAKTTPKELFFKIKESLYEKGLEEFAQKYGPLFGELGVDKKQGVSFIKESIEDWKAAQKVMEKILLADVFVGGKEIDHDLLQDCFFIDAERRPERQTIQYSFSPGVDLCGHYASSIRKEIKDTFAGEDGNLSHGIWRRDVPTFDPCAYFQRVYSAECFPITPPFGKKEVTLAEVANDKEALERFAALLKIVVNAHTQGIYLGFRSPNADLVTRDGGAFMVLFENYLSYMWYEFGLAFSREAFRQCENPKCQRIIVSNTDTSNKKRFCSDRCRAQANNAKITEQERRAKQSFYAVKLYKKIYEDVFGGEYSNSDGEHVKKKKRLDRWLLEAMQTKKGKAVLPKSDPEIQQLYFT
jgi:hypothetical protein